MIDRTLRILGQPGSAHEFSVTFDGFQKTLVEEIGLDNMKDRCVASDTDRRITSF
jgi:hypothetical protein